MSRLTSGVATVMPFSEPVGRLSKGPSHRLEVVFLKVILLSSWLEGGAGDSIGAIGNIKMMVP